ncbi:hypothetical protein [Komagataeibacter xylinus]|uniref:hypothetical protein n=1 Tax=Komagataeibacter xylinus TaxID=28448 RepID=UPI001013D3B1|nr:hypothetical protein [Komagataeibacter xylinus]
MLQPVPAWCAWRPIPFEVMLSCRPVHEFACKNAAQHKKLFEKLAWKTFRNHKEVFDEAFFKKLRRTPFFEKRQHPKTFIFFNQ